MKSIRLFETTADFTKVYKKSNDEYVEPWLSYVKEGDKQCNINIKEAAWVITNKDGGILSEGSIDNSITTFTNLMDDDIATNATTVTFNHSIDTIGQNAFKSYTSLTNIIVNSDLKVIDDWGFYNNEELTTFPVPEGVEEIGYEAFAECPKLASITLPSTLKTMGGAVFRNDISLKSIVIPDNVTEIGEKCFASCESLTDVTIGSSVNSIGHAAFIYCESLQTITIKGDTLPSLEYWLDDNADGVKSGGTVYGPVEADYDNLEALADTGWLAFAVNKRWKFVKRT